MYVCTQIIGIAPQGSRKKVIYLMAVTLSPPSLERNGSRNFFNKFKKKVPEKFFFLNGKPRVSNIFHPSVIHFASQQKTTAFLCVTFFLFIIKQSILLRTRYESVLCAVAFTMQQTQKWSNNPLFTRKNLTSQFI